MARRSDPRTARPAIVLIAIVAWLAAAPRPGAANSVFSVGGLGEPSLEETARLRALGGAGAAAHGETGTSMVNPTWLPGSGTIAP